MAGAALETSLTLEEADRMLSALAAKGHLEVTVEHGRLLYSLWEGDAPLYRVSDLANAPVWRYIHLVAWKGRSPKYGCDISHIPVSVREKRGL